RARFGVAMTHYHKHDFEKAKEVLETIPSADRSGELAVVPYLIADCLIRLTPTRADDALAAGRMQEMLQEAIQLLDGFVAAQPNGPLTPDALLKLGFCYQKMASLLAKPNEKNALLATARNNCYKRIYQAFPQHPL